MNATTTLRSYNPAIIPALADRVNQTPEVVAIVVERLCAGMTLTNAFAGTTFTYAMREHVVRAINWTLAWRNKGLRASPKVGSLTKDEAMRLLEQRVPQVEIAKLAGVSRQRIQQVEKDAGRRRRMPRRPGPKRDPETMGNYLRKARQMMNKGADHDSIANAYGIGVGELRAHLIWASRHLGGEWTMASAPILDKPLAVSLDHLRAHMTEAQQMWEQRTSLATIAAKYGMAIAEMKRHMSVCRQHLEPQWFRHRLAPWVVVPAGR